MDRHNWRVAPIFRGPFPGTNGSPGSVKTGWVNTLLATPDGFLWVGLDGGLFRLTPQRDWQAVSPAPNLPDLNNILTLARTSDGVIWAAGRTGLANWNGQNWQENPEIPSLGIKAIAEDPQARLWLAVETQTGNQVWILEPATHQLIKPDGKNALPEGVSISVIQAGTGHTMWVGTDSGLFEYSDLSLVQEYTTDNGLISEVILALCPHPEGGLWVGTTRGVQRLEGSKVTEMIQSIAGLPGSNARALLYNSEGGFWIGTENGAARLPGLAWETEQQTSLGSQAVRAILAGSDKTAYAATEDQIFYQGAGGNWRTIKPENNGLTFYALATDEKGGLWIGTDHGLAQWEDSTWTTDDRIPSNTQVYAILPAQAGGLWVGTDQGVYQLQEGASQLSNQQSGALGIDIVTTLWQTRAGDIWVGTLNGGASRWHQGAWTIFTRGNTGLGLASDIITAGLEDYAGNLWFATQNGLSRLAAGADPSLAQSWHTFQPPEISSAQVRNLWEDRQRPELLWVGTAGGLSLIEGDQASVFGNPDGLPALQINSFSQEADGTLWIGTGSGLIYHHDARQAPRLESLDLVVNQQICASSCLQKGISYRNNTVEIQYSGLDLATPTGLQYQVILESQEKGSWQIIEQIWTKETHLTRLLQPGREYRFSVVAYDRDFNGSFPDSSGAFLVKAPTVWDWLVDHPLILGLLGLALVLLSISSFRLWQHLQLFNFPIKIQLAATLVDKELSLELKARRGLEIIELAYPATLDLPDLIDSEKIVREELTTQLAETSSPLQELGTKLHAILWPPGTKEVHNRLTSLGLGRRAAHLNLDLHRAPQLRSLPWETLYGGQPPAHLAIHGQMAIVRDLSSESAQAPANTTAIPDLEKIQIMAAWASPRDMAQLFAEDMHPGYFEALLRDHPRRRRLKPSIILAQVRWEQWVDTIQHGCTIVQFDGHGGYDPGRKTGVLYFVDERNEAVPIYQDELVDLMKSLAPEKKPRLICLNACRTADYNQVEAQASLAEALVSEGGVTAAVGMGYPIPDQAARIFRETFYKALLNNGQPDYAVMEGRKRLANELGTHYRAWAIPRLYCRIPTGEIFRWK